MNEPNGNGTCFHFDDVLGSSATQEDVYRRVAAEAADSVLHGYNGTKNCIVCIHSDISVINAVYFRHGHGVRSNWCWKNIYHGMINMHIVFVLKEYALILILVVAVYCSFQSGGKTSFTDRGVCARSISNVFRGVQQDTENTYIIRVSYIEIYNEQLFDLLDFSEAPESVHGVASPQKELVIQENDHGRRKKK